MSVAALFLASWRSFFFFFGLFLVFFLFGQALGPIKRGGGVALGEGLEIGEGLLALPEKLLGGLSQGPAQGAAAQGRQQRRLGGAEAPANQVLGDERVGQGREGQLLAAGNHGGEKVGLHPGGEDEQILGRRFLQGFQQGIGRLRRQSLRGFNQGHPPAPGHGGVGGEAAKSRIWSIKISGLRPLEVGRMTRKSGWDPPARRLQEGQSPQASPSSRRLVQFKAPAKAVATDFLPHPLGPQEQIGVGQPPLAERRLEIGQHPLLPEDVPEEEGGGASWLWVLWSLYGFKL